MRSFICPGQETFSQRIATSISDLLSFALQTGHIEGKENSFSAPLLKETIGFIAFSKEINKLTANDGTIFNFKNLAFDGEDISGGTGNVGIVNQVIERKDHIVGSKRLSVIP